MGEREGGGEDEGRVLEEAPPTEPHLQLSQIISAREVRGGEMSKYLNKFHRSLLRVGRCGEGGWRLVGIVGANGVERG